MTPGIYDLATLAITTAITNSAQTAITDLDGMASANIVCELLGATAGSTIVAKVQTSFDGGTTWLDVARFDYATTASTKFCVLETTATKAVTAYGALGSESVNNGLLGDRLRAIITSTGTYTGTTINIRVSVH